MSLSIQSDEHFMKLALGEAKIAYEEGEIPVGVVITAENRVVAKGHNQVQRLNDVTAHAEMLAITAAQNHLNTKYLDQCALYVTLEPCAMCAGAIFWAQLGKLVFGATDDKRGFRSINPSMIHPKTSLKAGLMAEESAELVKSFFARMRGNNF